MILPHETEPLIGLLHRLSDQKLQNVLAAEELKRSRTG